ncbi:MAG: thiol reductant ABC exporter subunit CydC [Actinomycetaceae bacterium]|nr:thiol reductant ABC exporter subunit CydC [Actinomycetaceae bacterium]MDY6083308.1 thiol reductant ABC exporter subunit CydC [Actinomycetaceae bacterium]
MSTTLTASTMPSTPHLPSDHTDQPSAQAQHSHRAPWWQPVLSARQRRAVHRAIQELAINPTQFILAVLFGAGALGFSVALSAVSAWLIARASQMPSVAVLSIATVGVRFFGIGRPLFRYLNRIATHKVALYGMAHLRTRVYSVLAESPTDVVTSLSRGDLLTRTGRDVDSVGNLVVRGLQPAATAVLVCLISVVTVGILSPAIGVVLLLCLLLAGVAGPYMAMRGSAAAERSQLADRAELATTALTVLESADELYVSGRHRSLDEARARTERRIAADRDFSAKPMALAQAVSLAAMGIVELAAVLIGTHAVASGALTGVQLAVVVLTPLASFEATDALAKAGIQLVESAAAAERIMVLFDAATSTHSVEDPEPTPPAHVHSTSAESVANADAYSSTGVRRSAELHASTDLTPAPTIDDSREGLIVNNVMIGWPGYPDIAGPLSIDIHRGETLAIVGPSGIGKTTLLFTLAGMLPPKSGHVYLDGQEVSTMQRAQVSQTLSLTAEDAHVFATSVIENIRVARSDVTEQEAEQLLGQAGLGAWLAQLPDGVHTQIAQDSANISGGERRRLLLARALASPAEFLLLDEPGEHIDPETADALIRDLLHSGEQPGRNRRTVILVTHRLTPLDAADRVIVLSQVDGHTRITATGSHEELIRTLPEYRFATGQEGSL